MSALPLVLIGGGENARVVAEAARSRPEQWSLRGYLAPERDPAGERRLDTPWLGTDSDAERLARDPGVRFVLAVGGTRPGPRRGELVARYTSAGARFATLVHADARVSPSATLAPGAMVYAAALINAGARLEAHVLVGCGAIVEHDVVLEELVQVGPGAVLGGGAHIGPGAFLGLGCRVRDHVQVGRAAVVGMGAVLVGDAPAGATMLGVPARAVAGAPC